MTTDELGNFFISNFTGAECANRYIDGLRHTDCVRNLNLAARSKTRGHDVLGHITAGISGRTVDLGRVLTREGAAAVRASTAISVNDNLSAGQAAVALGTADHKTAGWVNQEAGVLEPFLRQNGFNDVLNHGFDEFGLHLIAVAHAGMVLRGQHNGVDSDRAAIFIAQGYLALSVGTQKVERAVAANNGLLLHETVSVVNSGGH